jgi:hypothetical protein
MTLQSADIAEIWEILIQTDRFSVYKMSGTLCQNGKSNVNVQGKADFFNALQKLTKVVNLSSETL